MNVKHDHCSHLRHVDAQPSNKDRNKNDPPQYSLGAWYDKVQSGVQYKCKPKFESEPADPGKSREELMDRLQDEQSEVDRGDCKNESHECAEERSDIISLSNRACIA